MLTMDRQICRLRTLMRNTIQMLSIHVRLLSVRHHRSMTSNLPARGFWSSDKIASHYDRLRSAATCSRGIQAIFACLTKPERSQETRIYRTKSAFAPPRFMQRDKRDITLAIALQEHISCRGSGLESRCSQGLAKPAIITRRAKNYLRKLRD